MICLGGGPSHVDTYDMKPEAPAEIRGEFRPDPDAMCRACSFANCCRRQAKIADKFAVVRSATWQEPDHQRIEIFTGFPKAGTPTLVRIVRQPLGAAARHRACRDS